MLRQLRTAGGLAAGMLAAGLLAGCRGGQTGAVAKTAAPPPTKITAYINVSSGCQQPTIELLKSFPQQYPGRVQVEIVDFGDQGGGNRRWKQSGHDCMTIEIDGSPFAKLDSAGKTRTVALRQPVGFWWTHDDLKAAVAAAVDGKLQQGTEEEAIAGQPPHKVKATIVTEAVRRDGKASSRVLINERAALLIRVAWDAEPPDQRAESAARVLREWLKNPVKPNEIDRKQVEGGWAVRVKGKVVAVATAADGEAMGGTPDQVAKKWLVGIRQGIAIAARPDGTAAPVRKQPASKDGCETGG